MSGLFGLLVHGGVLRGAMSYRGNNSTHSSIAGVMHSVTDLNEACLRMCCNVLVQSGVGLHGGWCAVKGSLAAQNGAGNTSLCSGEELQSQLVLL